MPLFAEQDYNAEKIVRIGYGIQLEITTITQQELETAIREIIQDERYLSAKHQAFFVGILSPEIVIYLKCLF
jgi:UDP:flavonoid glycosyltransferase YjiC (YdhE family)